MPQGHIRCDIMCQMSAKMGRPPKDPSERKPKRLTVPVELETSQRIDRIARESGVTVAQIVRDAIQDYFDRLEE